MTSILAYHHIGDPPPGPFALLHVRVAQLDRQLWALRRLGLRGVSMREGLADLSSHARRGRVVLTFDDGYVDALTHAAPLLRQYGFRATCYVVAEAIGTFNRWDEARLGQRAPLLDARGIEAWLAAGMEIGSHGCTHARLPGLDAREMEREIVESRSLLRGTFGGSVDDFAYPYGAFDERSVALVRQTYRSGVTTVAGRAKPRADPHTLPRLLVEGTSGLASFVVRVATPWVDVRQRSRGFRA